MRGHDQRGLLFLPQGAKEFDDLLAGMRVQVAGGFIRQNQVRLVDQRTRDGDALLLAARKFGRATLQKSLDAQNGRDFVDAAINFGLGRLEPSERLTEKGAE